MTGIFTLPTELEVLSQHNKARKGNQMHTNGKDLVSQMSQTFVAIFLIRIRKLCRNKNSCSEFPSLSLSLSFSLSLIYHLFWALDDVRVLLARANKLPQYFF
jgi:hypothetical protein